MLRVVLVPLPLRRARGKECGVENLGGRRCRVVGNGRCRAGRGTGWPLGTCDRTLALANPVVPPPSLFLCRGTGSCCGTAVVHGWGTG